MNTNLLKRFAQEARKKLIQQVGAKLEWVLQADTPELREKSEQLNALRKALLQTSKEQLIDTVAYTWFNRLVALRFMDVNGYQPLRVQVRSEEHTSELQSRPHLVCRLLLEKKKTASSSSPTPRTLRRPRRLRPRRAGPERARQPTLVPSCSRRRRPACSAR